MINVSIRGIHVKVCTPLLRKGVHTYNCFYIMTKEDFDALHLDLHQSGLSNSYSFFGQCF